MLVLLILVKLWLVSDQTLFARAEFMHDDLLFVRLADNLLQFDWLGPYNNLTLAKGPFYPIWIAFAFAIGVPLLLSQHLLYIAACLVTYYALQPLIERLTLRIAFFTLLLYNPVTFTFQLTCVLRDALYPSLTLLLTSLTIGLFARRHKPTRSLAGWSVASALVISAFWLTREEALWILPFLVPVQAWTLMTASFAERRDWWKITVLTLPFLLTFLTLQAVSLVNFSYYGVYTTTEFKTSEFKAAYGALSRVLPVKYKPQVPVQKETRQRIYAVSEAFAELKPFFEQKDFWTLQSMGFENYSSDSDEIGGGWFMWALRDAVAAAGYFSSGARASTFFQRLANEINNACKEKKLDCLEERASLMPPWRNEYFSAIAKQIAHGFTVLATFVWLSPDSDIVVSEGSPTNLLLFQDLTREKLAAFTLNEQGETHVMGWAVHASETLIASLIETKTHHIVAVAQFNPSPDVFQYFLSMNKNIMGASHARFEVQGQCITPCVLRIADDKGALADIPLKRGSTAFSTHPLWVYFDEVSINTMPRQTQIKTLKQSFLQKIIMAYQITGPFLTIITLVAMSIWLIRSFKSRNPTVLGFIALCIAMALCTRLLLLAIIEVTSFPAIGVVYLSPLYPLLLLCYSLFLSDFLAQNA